MPLSIVPSSAAYDNAQLKAQDRIIDICLHENADIYVNAIGGRELYDSSAFSDKQIQLRFLESKFAEYSQAAAEFNAGLSIIDVLMCNSAEEIRAMCAQYQLSQPVTSS